MSNVSEKPATEIPATEIPDSHFRYYTQANTALNF